MVSNEKKARILKDIWEQINKLFQAIQKDPKKADYSHCFLADGKLTIRFIKFANYDVVLMAIERADELAIRREKCIYDPNDICLNMNTWYEPIMEEWLDIACQVVFDTLEGKTVEPEEEHTTILLVKHHERDNEKEEKEIIKMETTMNFEEIQSAIADKIMDRFRDFIAINRKGFRNNDIWKCVICYGVIDPDTRYNYCINVKNVLGDGTDGYILTYEKIDWVTGATLYTLDKFDAPNHSNGVGGYLEDFAEITRLSSYRIAVDVCEEMEKEEKEELATDDEEEVELKMGDPVILLVCDKHFRWHMEYLGYNCSLIGWHESCMVYRTYEEAKRAMDKLNGRKEE